ncbi:MAG: response regulator [Calditrichaeota bacterium]|nr:response regulator [Calditrichota bacterium]MCB0267937.1 response regulator [Calditrichota bacterium]
MIFPVGSILEMFQIIGMTNYSRAFNTLSDKQMNQVAVKLFEDPLSFIDAALSLEEGIAVLDVDLLKSRTTELVSILQKFDEKLPIIIFTSTENLAVCSDVFSMGISKYLTKPITPQCFKTLVESIKYTINKSNKDV